MEGAIQSLRRDAVLGVVSISSVVVDDDRVNTVVVASFAFKKPLLHVVDVLQFNVSVSDHEGRPTSAGASNIYKLRCRYALTQPLLEKCLLVPAKISKTYAPLICLLIIEVKSDESSLSRNLLPQTRAVSSS
jgi:hypothetical protein